MIFSSTSKSPPSPEPLQLRPRLSRWQRLGRYGPASLALTVGIGLSVGAALLVGRWEHSLRQMQFQRQADNLATALQRNINRYTEVLLSVGDLYAVSSSEVSPTAFQTFVQRAIAFNSGIQALEWAPRVPQSEHDRFEQQMRQAGYLDFIITERNVRGQLVPVGDRPDYFPVTYIEPWVGNEVALGFDLASNTTRRLALEAARDRGAIATSGRIRLVQEQTNQFGFLVFLPVYRTPPAPTLAARRQAIAGMVLGVFRVANVVEEALEKLSYDIDFYLYDDQTASPDERFLGFYDSSRQQVRTIAAPPPAARLGPGHVCPSFAACTHTLNVGGRQWSVLFVPASIYGTGDAAWGAVATLGIGLFLTVSLVFYLLKAQAELDRTRELSDMKLRFFSMVSHEFRTPLSTVLLSAQSLETNHQELSDQQKIKAMQRIQSAAKRMSQLLSNLLTLTRAESGKLEFAPVDVNLQAFCTQLVDDLQQTVSGDRPIHLTCDLAAPTACLDPTLLLSMLTNLLSNAVKYSPPDSPVSLTVTSSAAAVTITVQDRGKGIPPEVQAHVFEAFYRGKNIAQIAGTGLGLAVVKTCTDLHGGSICVTSHADAGTQFTITLPQSLAELRPDLASR